ncbi:MAG: prepilin peptidase [Deltaproteobacteria bacterium]|nr:prepilin peptidase [Deltaproteobacteria bacterium]
MTLEQAHLFSQGWAFVVALCVGSFMNVCIARMPEDRSVAYPPSHCPSCGAGIRWFDNVPVLSWVLLRAKCRACKSPISPLYPAIELLVGCLGLLLFRQLVPSPAELTLGHFAAWSVYLAFIGMLVATTYIDLRHYIIPDQFSVYAAPFGVLAAVGLGALGFDGGPSWREAVVGAVIGAATPLSILLAYKLLRGEDGMGYGDVKLLGMIGAFLGPWPTLAVVMIGSIFGSIIGIGLMITQGRGFRTQLPFGPFLAVGGIIVLFFSDTLLARWLPGLGL